MEDYVCPKCQSKAPITIEGKVLCLNCGTEMQTARLYSDIIWPSLKEVLKSQPYEYDKPLLDLTAKLIKSFETENLPQIKEQKLILNVPEIHPKDIYELRKAIDSLIEKLCLQIEKDLDISEIRETIKRREISMTVCSKYATHSESPPEQYKIALDYIKQEMGKLEIGSDPHMERLIKKLEEEKKQCEADWKHSGASATRL